MYNDPCHSPCHQLSLPLRHLGCGHVTPCLLFGPHPPMIVCYDQEMSEPSRKRRRAASLGPSHRTATAAGATASSSAAAASASAMVTADTSNDAAFAAMIDALDLDDDREYALSELVGEDDRSAPDPDWEPNASDQKEPPLTAAAAPSASAVGAGAGPGTAPKAKASAKSDRSKPKVFSYHLLTPLQSPSFDPIPFSLCVIEPLTVLCITSCSVCKGRAIDRCQTKC
jgi:hypothetical protein